MITELNINPSSTPVTEVRTYTEKELVQFGNYLLSYKRLSSLWEGHHEALNFNEVHQEDIDNAFDKPE